MALTKVSTDGVKDDAITKTKIPANQIEASELADNAVDTNAIANDAVTVSKIQNVAQDRILGRQSSGTGDLQELNAGNVRLMLNVADGANQTTINNNADNRVITGSGTANTLNGESGLIFDGTNLGVGITPDSHNASVKSLQIGTATNLYNETSDDYTILGNNVYFHSGGTNKRIKAQECSRIMMNAGEFVFERAGADSADSNITFTRHFKIDANGNAFVENPSEARLQVKTPSNGIIALRADGGNTQLGTWSDHDLKIVRNTTIKASITANGLCFNGDTAAANALDDYEEGTFDAINNYNTVWYSNENKCSYTKIGRQVTVMGQIRLYSGSGDVKLGLPFNTANGLEGEFKGAGALNTYGYDWPTGTSIGVLIEQNTAYVYPAVTSQDNGGWNVFQHDAGGYLRFTFTYFTS